MRLHLTASLATAALLLCLSPEAGARTPRHFNILRGHDNYITQLCIAADGRLMASVSQDATVRVWRLPSGRPAGTLKAGDDEAFGAIALSPDGKLLAVVDGPKVKLYALGKSGLRKMKTLQGNGGEIRDLAFNREATALASAADGVRLWSIDSGTTLATLAAGEKAVAVAFSPTNGTLAVALEDGLHLYDTGTHQEAARTPVAELVDLVYSPDGSSLAGRAGEGKLVMFSNKGKLSWTAEGLSDLTALSFAKEGKLVISGTDSDEIKAFRVAGGKTSWQFKGPASVAFFVSSDRYLATASANQRNDIWLWRIP